MPLDKRRFETCRLDLVHYKTNHNRSKKCKMSSFIDMRLQCENKDKRDNASIRGYSFTADCILIVSYPFLCHVTLLPSLE